MSLFMFFFFFFLANLYDEIDSKELIMAKTHTFGKPDWFDIVESEYEACRENVSILDYSSFTKLDIQVSKLKYFIFLYVIVLLNEYC